MGMVAGDSCLWLRGGTMGPVSCGTWGSSRLVRNDLGKTDGEFEAVIQQIARSWCRESQLFCGVHTSDLIGMPRCCCEYQAMIPFPLLTVGLNKAFIYICTSRRPERYSCDDKTPFQMIDMPFPLYGRFGVFAEGCLFVEASAASRPSELFRPY